MVLWQVITWGIIAVVLICAEIATVQMISIWFAAGSIGAFIAALFGADLAWQLVIFAVVSILLLIFTRPIIKKKINVKKIPTNADSIIGMTGVVYEKFDLATGTGRIRVSGLEYAAKCEDNQELDIDQKCEVIRIEGVKAIVKAKP